MSAAPHAVEARVWVRPPWPFRLGGGSADGLMRRRGAALQRLLHVDGEPVLVGILQPDAERVLFAARADTEAAAEEGIARMRFATGVDDDLRPFHDAFRDDPVIGRAVRAHPHLRVRRRPDPWEALAAAVTEQLIEFERAIAIQRRLIAALGTRCQTTGLRDAPPPSAVAAEAPARLVALDLAPKRAIALRRAAEEVASGRANLWPAISMAGGRAEPRTSAGALRRLRAIPEIGRWTLEMLALHGLGRHDIVAAGDLGYLKLVGRLRTGHPRVRAAEEDARAFFEPYGAWKGLAGEYLRWGAARGLVSYPAGRRWSAPAVRPAAA